MQQLLLFPWNDLSDSEKGRVFDFIRSQYWWIRNLRRWRGSDAARRKAYRVIEDQKKRLQLAGVSKEEILAFLRCCRGQCGARKQPFEACPYCQN